MFVVKSGEKHKVVVDGVEGSEYIDITDPVFSPTSEYVAYTAQQSGQGQVLVINSIEAKRHESFLNNGRIRFDKKDQIEMMALKGGEVFKIGVRLSEFTGAYYSSAWR